MTLVTIVDPPHYDLVTSLAVGQSHAITAAGRQFKVWSMGSEAVWECTMAGSFQDLPCSHVAVSPDSSLIAAAFEKVRPCVW